MKLIVSRDRLKSLVAEAKAMPGMRIGQHVFNTLTVGTAIESPRLFYCADSEFWTVIHEFVTIEG